MQYVPSVATGGASIGGLQANGFYMLDSSPAVSGNAHPIQALRYASYLQNWVVESINNQEQGDAIQFGHSDAIPSAKITVRNGVVVQPPGGFFGVIVNNSATAAHDSTHQHPEVTSRNITWRGGSSGNTPGGSIQQGAAGGEGANNQGKAGLYEAVRNNIVWAESPGPATFITDYYGSSTGVTPPVAGTFTLADHNVYWNVTGAAVGGFYKYSTTSPAVYSTPPGVNDVNINPRLVDTTRNFLNWGKSINPSHTTIAQVLDEICKMADDSGYDPRYSISDLLKWVRWGYVPQEPKLWVAPDGDFYGGVDPTPLKIAAASSSF
jgi:hypothetical protein